MSFLSSLFNRSGDNATALKRAIPIVEATNAHEEIFRALSDEQLKAKTLEFKARLAGSVPSGSEESLEDLAPEAFAAVREASRRTLGQRHFDVQLIGGMILHNGDIAEMKTGEGKTLVATLPAYLNALSARGVHVVTVNDYLSRRDGVWMGQIYHALGMSVGIINHEASYLYDPTHATKEDAKEEEQEGSFKIEQDFLRPCTRREAYEADITYGTNNEFGFDFLRDNLEYDAANLRQWRGVSAAKTAEGALPGEASGEVLRGGYHFAIVDEIDSILIDEARTPLIISAPIAEAESLYTKFAELARSLQPEDDPSREGESDADYTVDEKHKQISLTEAGIEKAEKALGVENIYTDAGIKFVHHLETAVKAKALYERDKQYVVRDDQVVIVDEFTGRMQPGRRWSDGLHQAIEAKEGVHIQQESRTFASITFQNYFRLYSKLCGMTGTAVTSSEEFYKVYGLNTVVVPTNRPVARDDQDDFIFQTERGKMKAIAQEVKELHQKGQPVLIGTVSVEKNELLSAHFRQEGIPHEVLNAKNHEREGEIIAQAGRKAAVTISTNMAGRGVDIKLGGNPGTPELYEEVKSLGGLFVLGTERHEARRIDNQLRGRAGRQGDPGTTQFYVSLEDSLMRVFASDAIKRVMGTFKIPEDEPIQNGMITRSLEKAQTRIEELNFDARKHVLSYDDVLNIQRQSVYTRRRMLLTGSDADIDTELERIAETIPNADALPPGSKTRDDWKQLMEDKKKEMGEHFWATARRFLLQTIDGLWVEHLEQMEYLRSSVNLRAYGQRDPLVEYKKEGLRLFQTMEETYALTACQVLPNLLLGNLNAPTQQGAPAQAPAAAVHIEPSAVEKAARSITAPSSPAGKRAYERNDRVRITNGTEVREVKYKKAEGLFKQGWRIAGE